MIVARSSAETSLDISSKAAGLRFRAASPRRSTSESFIAPGAPSKHTTCSSAERGTISRSRSASWRDPARAIRAPESTMSSSICGTREEVKIGTVAAPWQTAAKSAIAHSGRLLARIATRSPRPTPSSRRPAARARTRSLNCAEEVGFHDPPSRWSVRSERPLATAAEKKSTRVFIGTHSEAAASGADALARAGVNESERSSVQHLPGDFEDGRLEIPPPVDAVSENGVPEGGHVAVSYTHLRAHETRHDLV